MKKLFATICILASVVGLKAQITDTYTSKDRGAQFSDDTLTANVLVIPANKKMYTSYFDKQMCQVNSMEFNALRDTILTSLAAQIAVAFQDSTTSGVIPESNSTYAEDMDFVYESVSYIQEELPQPKTEDSSLKKFQNKFKRKPKEPAKKGTYMENGQIVTYADNTPKFTNIKCNNTDFLFLLNRKYQSNYFVFVNMYEMVISTQADQMEIQSENYPRVIRVHYTVIDVEGNEVSKGVAEMHSSSYDDELDYLLPNTFSQLGREIASQTPLK